MPANFRLRTVVPVAALVLWVLGTGLAFGEGEAESLSASFRKAARRVLPAVVTVKPLGIAGPVELTPGEVPLTPAPRVFAPDGPPAEAGGSGVVIDGEKGYVLTNDHVVQNASRVVVILRDGRERPVSQIRRDPKSDLALLIVDGKGLTRADWGDSEVLDTGDWVLAVGQPFGLSDTVTAGIVSGKGRGIGMAMYEDLIQTDAAINPGNSGGPLINLKGEVVGINTALKTRGGGYEGVGFAIPSRRARRVAADLAEHGRVRRSYLGVQIGPPDREAAARIDQPGAVVVNGVSANSPAAEAGLIRDDVLLKLDGKPLGGIGALQAAIEFAPEGQPLTFAIDRDGERREIQVVPRAQPESFGLPEPRKLGPGGRRRRESREPPRPPDPPRAPALPKPPAAPDPPGEAVPGVKTEVRTTDVNFASLGLRLTEPWPDLAQRFRPRHPALGLLIVGIEPGGPADRGGLDVGMVITNIVDSRSKDPVVLLDVLAGRDRTDAVTHVNTIRQFDKALTTRPKERDLVVRVLKGTKTEFHVFPGTAESRTEHESNRAREAGRDAQPKSR